MTSSIKVKYMTYRNATRLTEQQPQGICTKNFVKIGPAVPEICSWTDRHTHTDRQTDCNTPLPYWGRVKIVLSRRAHVIEDIKAKMWFFLMKAVGF